MTDGLKFFSNPSDILTHLIASMETGTMIGVNALKLGTDTCLTAVRNLLYDDPIIVMLHEVDIHGTALNTTRLTIDEIQSVIPFHSKFDNLFLKVWPPLPFAKGDLSLSGDE